MVLKLQLPDGDYIQLPEDYSNLELLGEVCTLDPEKLERLIDKQVSRRPSRRIPNGLVVESSEDTPASACEDNGVMLREERSSKKPPMMLTADDDDSTTVLHSNKRIRSWETSDDNAANQKTTTSVAKKNSNCKTDHHQAGPNPPPAMPIDFRNKILQLVGPNNAAIISDEKLLIQKTLTLSDVSKNQNRLSIPTKQLRVDVKFLSDDEERLLSSRDGTNVGSLDNVMIIEPSLETSQVSFRMWKMKKPNGSSSSISYVITKTWNGIKERNQLKEGMIVQVWAIRVGENLWLALVRLPDH